MRRLLATIALTSPLWLLLTYAGCGKSSGAAGTGGTPGAGLGGTVGAGGPGAGTGALASCLDVPGGLPAPPSGTLPCELIPPGLQLSR